MFAWELYRYAQDYLTDGPQQAKRRPHLQGFINGIKAQVQIGNRESIEKIAAHIASQPTLKELADYFDVP